MPSSAKANQVRKSTLLTIGPIVETLALLFTGGFLLAVLLALSTLVERGC